MKTRYIGAHVIDPATGIDGVFQVLVEDGKILAVDKEVPAEGAQTVDLAGLYLVPGFVDLHCHLRDPGFTYKEDIQSGTRAAARGGFTGVCCMANTNPVNDCASITQAMVAKAAREGVVRVYPIGAISKGFRGEELAEMGLMKQAGIVAVSDDGKPVISARLMYMALRYAASFDLPVVSHCEEMSLAEGGVMNEGFTATLLGLKGIPRSAEEVMIAREILLAEELGLPVHIAHVSTRGGAELIRHAKARGVRVTAETTPHYISLTDKEVEFGYAQAKVNPPLREAEDVEALIEALLDGTIDAIATDHAPHHADEKNVEINLAASGFSGFETAFALCYTHLVKTGRMTLSMLVEKMSCAPARLFKLQGGTLAPGADADFAVLDIHRTFKVDPETFLSKGKNTPLAGRELTGTVVRTVVAGQTAYEEA